MLHIRIEKEVEMTKKVKIQKKSAEKVEISLPQDFKLSEFIKENKGDCSFR